MISKKGNGSTRIGMLPAIIIGTVAAICVCGTAALIEPIFILNEYFESKSVHVIAIVIHTIASLVGALIASSGVSNKKWAAAGASVGLFYIALVSCGILFFESDPGKYIAGFLGCAAGTVLSLLLSTRKKKTRGQKRTKHRSR